MLADPQTTAETARKHRLACSDCHGSFFSSVWRMRCPACVEACARMMYHSLPDEISNDPPETTMADGINSREAFGAFIERLNTKSAAALLLERDSRGIYTDKGVQAAWAMWVAAIAWTRGETCDVV